ncbi:hypothetical protein BCR43DRAFT_517558 [Syncephalastrum racemosum]|uniref:AMP-dependent synthetase/ligase domain-containing protein n=1 Tax=Syncephalastrum racemosum TaxID=13706 RepID=A0A1X2H4K6_SYNRA|nr:hypothetical protein BCR43DRAFT_517558 [Syncephalastrum racemosum]
MAMATPEQTDALLPVNTIYELLFERNPKKDAVILVDAEVPERFHTVASLEKRTLKFARILQEKYDWKAGDVLAICARNNIDYVAVLHASVAIGGISAPVDHRTSAEDIADSLRIIQAKLLVTDDTQKDIASEAAKLANLPFKVITFEEIEACLSDGTVRVAEPKRLSRQERDTTPAFLYFTSGTTGGVKKAACLSQKNAITYAVAMCMVPGGTCALSYVDFHHIGQLTQPCLHGIAAGVTYYVMNIESDFAKAPVGYDLSSLVEVRCAGDTVTPSLLTRFHEKHGIKIIPTYSLTEGGYVMAPSWGNALNGSSGRPAGSFISVKLVDDYGKEVTPGEIGEICIRSPMVAMGYYNNPEATSRAFDKEGYFHSGDLFRVAEDGEYFFVGRRKHLFKYFNHHLYPEDIEQVLIEHPYVSDCCVAGINSAEHMTAMATAFVVLAKERTPMDKDIVEVRREIQEFVDGRVYDARRLRGGIFIERSHSTADDEKDMKSSKYL